ncbi:MAG TPA: neutral zinc metallopeptidase [Nocardioides sp.]|nr:neutral zinc metallopeptidase [Nocardioides sp.]
MRYNPKARLDSSQVKVRRGGGRSGGGMGGLPMGGGGGGGLKVGGGIGGVIVLVLIFLLQSQLGGSPSVGPGAGGGSGTETSLENCESGADANRDRTCALQADVNSIQAFWSEALPEQTGVEYREATTILFPEGRVDTGCGSATSDVGPFYCSVDERVYLDPAFFEEMLQGQLGARGGPFSEAYVIAHEYGHHVQNILGTMGQVRTQQGPNSDAVRLELQADCYAGIWAKYATEVPDETGEPFIIELTQQDVEDALDAARAVGDDRIQKRSTGRVDPDRWTHGSAQQRMDWFNTGRRTGSVEACDTFSASRL